MAEEKKKVGRPKKKVVEKESLTNEKTSRISMNEDIVSTTEQVNIITINDVTNRLSTMFQNFVNRGGQANSFKNTLNDGFKNNPFIQNQRIKEISSKIDTKDKKTLTQALLSPQNNEQLFREQSMSLFFQNYVYGNLLRLNREIPQYFNYILPQNLSKKDLESDKFKKDKIFLNKFIDKFNPPLAFKNIALQVAQEGKASYIFRESHNKQKSIVDFALLEKLPSDYVKYTGLGSDSPFLCSFNFMMFLNPMYSIDNWPPWFGNIWQQLQDNGLIQTDKNNNLVFKPNKNILPNHLLEKNEASNSYAYWVQLPQELVITFGSDLSTALQLPEYIGLFSDLKELESYKWLQAQSMLTNITNVLTGEVELAKDATAGSDATILTNDVILGFQDSLSSSLNSNILAYFAPFKNYKMHQLEHIPNAMDISLSELRNVISTSGNSALLNTSDKPSIAMIKGSQALQESKVSFLTLQFEKFMNNTINETLDLDFDYKFFLWGGCFSWKDEVKIIKELVVSGIQGMFPRLLSVYNTSLEDYKTSCDYMDVLGITIGNIDLKKENLGVKKKGRPETDENDIENDNTAISKETGSNVSDTKEFSLDACIKCGEELEDDEELICDDCLEDYYNQRVEEIEKDGDANE